MRKWMHYWFERNTVVRAVKIAMIVGPILTVINQYDVILRGDYSVRVVGKMLLTFLVPYCVSSFSSVSAAMERDAERKSGTSR